MIETVCVSDRNEIENLLFECHSLVNEVQGQLGFFHIDISLMWFDYFKSNSLGEYEKLRGRNHFGIKSRLNKYYLITARCHNRLVGVVPLVSITTKMLGDNSEYNILTFPGDRILIPYCDFLLGSLQATETVEALVTEMIDLLDEHDFIFLDRFPQHSNTITIIEKEIRSHSSKFAYSLLGIAGQRGGLRAWNISGIIKAIKAIISAGEHLTSQTQSLNRLEQLLSATNKNSIFFPGTRKRLENELISFIEDHKSLSIYEKPLRDLETLLHDQPVFYPFISLTNSREAYFDSLSWRTRKTLRQDHKKFIAAGGKIIKIDSNDISDSDISHLLDLHEMRWSDGSAYTSSKSRGFCFKLLSYLAANNLLKLYFAKNESKSVSALACVDYYGKREALISGRDIQRGIVSPGKLLIVESILDAVDAGMLIYDLGGGAFEYKINLTKENQVLRSLLITRSKLLHKNFHGLFTGFECNYNEANSCLKADY